MNDFDGKIVVVTGAAQGIGAAIAKKFFKERARVVLLDLNEAGVSEMRADIDPEGERTMALPCDVSDPESVAKAFGTIRSTWGDVAILVNNAGITRDALATKMTETDFDLALKVNLNGAFYCTKQVIEPMRQNAWGRIIFLSSIASRGNVGQANYAAAKAGIIGLTKTLSLELGNKNITVNCIAPGIINTSIIETIPESVLGGFLKAIPMKRFGEPEEVASLAAFLASDEAGYISGQCIRISGGLQ